MSLIIKPRKNE